MTCSDGFGFEYFHRPFPYTREPFQISGVEKVAFEGRFYSQPAYSVLVDKRLFTESDSHPVANPFTLYINRDAAVTTTVEPTLQASGYEVATPHYQDYILDLRNELDEIWILHAADSEHVANAFKIAHIVRQHNIYDLDTSSASGTASDAYVHLESQNTVPTGLELGADYFRDIDIDEVMWQPFTRPKDFRATVKNIPTEPIFPAALPGGSLPEFSVLDEEKYGILGLNAAGSGGILLTGDVLLEGSTLKLLTGSGVDPTSTSTFKEIVPWALFPAKKELCQYYPTENSGIIIASGRQAIYNELSVGTDGVYLLDVSAAGSSGVSIQHYPADYQSPDGLQPGTSVVSTTHDGVHITDKLIYNLSEMNPGQAVEGHSPINGKIVFGHFAGSEVGSEGQAVNGIVKYVNSNTIRGYGGLTDVFVSVPNQTSRFEWFSSNKTMSPVIWSELVTSILRPHLGIFGARPSIQYDVADINASETDGVITRLAYVEWGNNDRVIFPSADNAGGGQKTTETINFTTRVYGEGTDDDGNFAWIELAAPESPLSSSQDIVFYKNTFKVDNIFSNFLLKRVNLGFVNAGGQLYFQFSDGGATSQFNRIFTRAVGPRTTQLVPSQLRTDIIVVVGFFPAWKLRRYVTIASNQVEIPDTMFIGGGSVITFAGGLGIDVTDVANYGPPAWDDDTGVNYIYFNTTSSAAPDVRDRFFFAKMDTSFEIFEINEVDSADAILSGRAALLDI